MNLSLHKKLTIQIHEILHIKKITASSVLKFSAAYHTPPPQPYQRILTRLYVNHSGYLRQDNHNIGALATSFWCRTIVTPLQPNKYSIILFFHFQGSRSGFASSDQSKANLRWTVEASSILFCYRQFLSYIKHNLMHPHMKPLLE